eukprot:Hpha_TRINITY_DN14461_c0_g1::TRINITY_DN14461_c0_g1_i1::g.157243::m.157243
MATRAQQGNLVEVLSRTLSDFTFRNDQAIIAGHAARVPSVFEALNPPPIGVPAYFERIDRYSGASEECYLSALVLVDRLIRRNPHIKLSSWNVHRLLVTSVMVAAKARDDIFYSNKYYAAVAGLQVDECNFLESEFLQLIDWDLHVSFNDYLAYLREIDTRYGPLSGRSQDYLVNHPPHLNPPAAAANFGAAAGAAVPPGAATGDVNMSGGESDGDEQMR